MKMQCVSARRESTRFALGTLLLSASLSLFGQNTGTITGTVNDQQGAAVANARVQLVNEDQGGVVAGEIATNQRAHSASMAFSRPSTALPSKPPVSADSHRRT